MKKSVLYSLIASISMVSAGAYADPVADASSSALTTKGYVDTGLKYVYDSIQSDVGDIQVDVTNLQNTVGAPASGGNAATGLVGDVEALQDAVGTAGQGEQPGTGLTGRVESLEDAVTTLDNLGTDDLQANKKYILQTNSDGEGSWSELEVESSWNPGFLTGGN
ncbi:MAG: hypothetical protein IJL23_04140 [Alphaproteobacteria bacterium]|nr:hypothetical protein [Alphaproteobacteria bacterium]